MFLQYPTEQEGSAASCHPLSAINVVTSALARLEVQRQRDSSRGACSIRFLFLYHSRSWQDGYHFAPLHKLISSSTIKSAALCISWDAHAIRQSALRLRACSFAVHIARSADHGRGWSASVLRVEAVVVRSAAAWRLAMELESAAPRVSTVSVDQSAPFMRIRMPRCLYRTHGALWAARGFKHGSGMSGELAPARWGSHSPHGRLAKLEGPGQKGLGALSPPHAAKGQRSAAMFCQAYSFVVGRFDVGPSRRALSAGQQFFVWVWCASFRANDSVRHNFWGVGRWHVLFVASFLLVS